jgi:hypothetical protein
MIFNPNKPKKYTKSSTMEIPLSDGSGTEKYFCPYLQQCNLTYKGLKFAAFLSNDERWLNILEPNGDMFDMNWMPTHPCFGVSSSFSANIDFGTRPTKQRWNEETGKNETLEWESLVLKRTSFKGFGKRLTQSDLDNPDIFNEERLRVLEWSLRWQTEGLDAVNGNHATMQDYQESLREEMEALKAGAKELVDYENH